MITVVVERELREQLGQMRPDQQRQVLDFVRVLAAEKGTKASGQSLARFAGVIPKEDLAAIAQAVEEGCEQVAPNEW